MVLVTVPGYRRVLPSKGGGREGCQGAGRFFVVKKVVGGGGGGGVCVQSIQEMFLMSERRVEQADAHMWRIG